MDYFETKQIRMKENMVKLGKLIDAYPELKRTSEIMPAVLPIVLNLDDSEFFFKVLEAVLQNKTSFDTEFKRLYAPI